MNDGRITESDFKNQLEEEKSLLSQKVFSKEKYLQKVPADRTYIENRERKGLTTWVSKCEGKTRREMREMGFFTEEDWMI